MAIRNIFVEGDEVLRKKAKIVDEITPKVIELIDDMRETMTAANGVGIAAPQVGILKRVIIVHHDPEDESTYYEFINPEILLQEGTQEGTEGCLSLPGYVGMVERPYTVKMKAMDREGITKEYLFEGFPAVVVCHEIDHLNGVLYKDKATDYHKMDE